MTGAAIGAGAASVLWAAAACLLLALIVQCFRTIVDPPGFDNGYVSVDLWVSLRPYLTSVYCNLQKFIMYLSLYLMYV